MPLYHVAVYKCLLEQFKANPTVKILLATEDTAEIFASVKVALKKAGTPLPINDIWIASHVLESGAQLVSFDGHFKLIAGIRMFNTDLR